MATLTARTGQRIYPDVVRHVVENGRRREPRGLETRDVGFTVIELETPCRALPTGCGRDLNPNIAAAEAIQLVGGFSRPDLLLEASINFAQFLDGDGFHGAYGSRIRYQGAQVVDKIEKDRDTRQAVITLWNPELDNLEDMHDYPCTVALQFQVENHGQLCMNVFMRSSDVWLGLPYDMFQFSQLQFSIANALNMYVGWYRHTTLSLHIYEKDVEKTKTLNHGDDGVLQPKGIGRPGDSFSTIMKRARALTFSDLDEMTASERWYRERFASYMG